MMVLRALLDRRPAKPVLPPAGEVGAPRAYLIAITGFTIASLTLIVFLAGCQSALGSYYRILPGVLLVGAGLWLACGRAGDSGSARLSPRAFLMAVVVFCVAIRLLVVLSLPFTPMDDFLVYHEAGLMMADQWTLGTPGGFRCFLPPGQIFSLGVMYWLFGPHVLAGQVLNVVYAAGTVVAVWYVGQRLFGQRVGRAGAILCSLAPSQIFGCQLLGAEVPGAFWLVSALAVYCGTVMQRKHWLAGALLCGVLIGIGSLIRPTLFLLPIPLGLHMLICSRGWRRQSLVTAGLVGLGALVAVLPWTYRNYQVTGGFILISSNSGGNLWNANNDTTDGGYTEWVWQHLFTTARNDHELQQIGFDNAKAWIWQHPGQFAELAGRKFNIFWGNDHDIPWWSITRCGTGLPEWVGRWAMGLSNSFYISVLLAALLSVWRLRRKLWANGLWMILPVTAMYFTAIHMVFEAQGKYRFLLGPFLCILAGLLVQAAGSGMSMKPGAGCQEPVTEDIGHERTES